MGYLCASMLTRYKLKIGNEEYQLREDDLYNWDDIKVSYKRSELDGVVRSFSSQFEFVNRAKRLLWEAYLHEGVNTEAEISVWVQADDLSYEKKFGAMLDFSTLEVESHVLKLNSIDSSVASKIKANKTTKYEFVVGEELPVEKKRFLFERLPMIESATYEFTQGEPVGDTAAMRVNFVYGGRPWVGNVGYEVAINGLVDFQDDQTDETDGYILQAVKDVEITLEYDFEWDERATMAGASSSTLVSVGANVMRGTTTASGQTFVNDIRGGVFQLLNYGNTPTNENQYCVHNGTAWISAYNGSGYVWRDTGQSVAEYFVKKRKGSVTFNLQRGEKLVVAYGMSTVGSVSVCFLKSEMKFTWTARGKAVDFPVIDHTTLAYYLLEKMGTGITSVGFSPYDARLRGTYLVAAESIRNIDGAKFYTSFEEFCTWMSVVFGYTYVLRDEKTMEFLHRTELFANQEDPTVREMLGTGALKLSTETSNLYSTVTIGYEQKEYDGVNGRDEFNFNNTYSTGCTVSDKTLSLISKYRADSYGMEFAAQKRGEDTTDNNADQDVFFVLGDTSRDGEYMMADNSAEIEGSLSSDMLNGHFTPLRCVLANAEFLGITACPMTLTFASSTGNSHVVVSGRRMDSDIDINERLLMPLTADFTTDDVDEVADMNEMVVVADTDGVVYTGYLKEVELTFTRTEAAQYKIIVKEIIP